MSGPSKYTPIFARNCRVVKISAEQARGFLELNHDFGWSKCRHCYALVAEKPSETIPAGMTVAVSCFSNARRWEKEGRTVSSYEWIRYASLRGTRVLGGMGKTLNAFIEEMHPDDIMSYAPYMTDRETGDAPKELPGKTYLKLGFKQEGEKIFPNGKSLKFRFKPAYQ